MAEKRVDWEGLEPHYRAGVRALKDIGAEFGCSDAAIIKHAKKQGWTRNLLGKIQAKADAKVSAAMVSAEVSAQTKLTESVRVEVESEVQARVRLSHRTDIQRGKRITNALMAELEEQAAKPKKLPLKERASILKQLVETQRSQVAMEIQAYGIAQMSEQGDEAAIDPIVGARRLAFALQRAGSLISKGSSHG
jgi:citrate lyase alpha subunit